MTDIGMTTQQFNTPDTNLITSQATLRPLWPVMLSGFWPLPFTMQLPSMMKEILQNPQRDGQIVKSLPAFLVNLEEGERHKRNLNENELLKKQKLRR
ncbi:hypothetical protein RRG08_027976 [Elysia crispata]|uniref:Uncharacterized protein n=1 Tax=Elysia crispata TaxID=231223 RepID=A0AAE1EEL7_9GAST|nr:hypothetical protein RRG08_027976 [Elysia crispata]